MSQLVKRVAIAAANGPKALGAYSPAILVEGNKTLYISGQLGLQVTDDLSTRFDMMPIQADGELVPGVEDQTRQALVNMGHLLKAAGCDHRHVVKTTVLLKDIKDFPVVNDVYAEFFREDPPARATYQVLPHPLYVCINDYNLLPSKVGDLPRAASVEVEAIAVVGVVSFFFLFLHI